MVLCTKVTKQSISGLDIFMRSLLRNMLCPEERKLRSHKRQCTKELQKFASTEVLVVRKLDLLTQ